MNAAPKRAAKAVEEIEDAEFVDHGATKPKPEHAPTTGRKVEGETVFKQPHSRSTAMAVYAPPKQHDYVAPKNTFEHGVDYSKKSWFKNKKVLGASAAGAATVLGVGAYLIHKKRQKAKSTQQSGD